MGDAVRQSYLENEWKLCPSLAAQLKDIVTKWTKNGVKGTSCTNLLTQSIDRLIVKNGGSRKQHVEPVKIYCHVEEYNLEITPEVYTSEPGLMQDS